MTTSHPRVSERTRLMNIGFRVVRAIGDITPIHPVTMGAVNAVMAAPIVILSHRAQVEKNSLDGMRIDTVTHPDIVEPECTILHIHGGGFVFGSTRTHRLLASEMSRRCRARVVLFDYRLLTKHSMASALDDCLSAYRWTQTTYTLGPLVISGDSAGGSLMVSLLSRLQTDGLPGPLGAVGMSAWLDPDYVHQKGVTRDSLFSVRFADRAVLLAGHEYVIRPLESQLASTPLLMQCGADEPVRPGNETLVERLTEIEASASLHVWEDQPHVFQSLAPFVPEANDALDAVHAFITALRAADESDRRSPDVSRG